jgi:hypothetical protein
MAQDGLILTEAQVGRPRKGPPSAQDTRTHLRTTATDSMPMIELSSMLGCETDLPSPRLSPAQIIFVLFLINRLQDADFTGERGGNRTHDPLIKSLIAAHFQ